MFYRYFSGNTRFIKNFVPLVGRPKPTVSVLLILQRKFPLHRNISCLWWVRQNRQSMCKREFPLPLQTLYLWWVSQNRQSTFYRYFSGNSRFMSNSVLSVGKTKPTIYVSAGIPALILPPTALWALTGRQSSEKLYLSVASPACVCHYHP